MMKKVIPVLALQSFENVKKWIDQAKNNRRDAGGDDIMIVLVGNKIDDEENR